MIVPTRRNRSAALLAAVATVVPLGLTATLPGTAGAAPARTATTTSYTNTTFLQHALGLPASDTNPAIEPITYDRLNWQLQQPGKFALLIGDPATDATFAARAQDVESAALAAGAKKVYWFDPNLSGNAKVGDTVEPNLDIRFPAGITTLSATSQTIYGNAWFQLVGQYLGDGVTATLTGLGSESSKVTSVKGTATVNDSGSTAGFSTKLGDENGGALYDYSSGAAPSNLGHSFFLVYDKDNTVTISGNAQPAKVVSWLDLSTESAASAVADVKKVLGAAGGASGITQLDQFAWWKSEVNARQVVQGGSKAAGGDIPVLTDAADNDPAEGGWKVNQITYPELVDLLRSDTAANAVILFGGTWCPNTRPVLPAINENAQKNDAPVFNFDTVLDGGLVGGTTTSAVNPFQSRNTVNSGATTNANPTSLYGDLVNRYLRNINTEYDYTTGGPGVTYYPGGDQTGAPAVSSARKLQVPFLIGYQGAEGNGPVDGVKRQWIIKTGDTTYKEYMSSWAYTNPQQNAIGISTIPLDAPIWTTLNAQIAAFTPQTDPTTLYPNTTIDTDDAPYLVAADTATVTYTAATQTKVASVTVTSAGASPIAISPAALTSALSALGASAPANLAAAKNALIDAKTASTQDATLISNLMTVVGAWGVAQQRKSRVISSWGNATTPASVAGGVAAVQAVVTFFGGLPGGVVSKQSVTVGSGATPKIDLTITNDFGRTPAGNASLVVKQGGTTVATQSAAVSGGAASFTLPVLPSGTYDFALSYAGDDQIVAFTKTGSVTVTAAAQGNTGNTDTGTGNVPQSGGSVATPTTAPKAAGPATGGAPAATKLAPVKAGKVVGAAAKVPTHSKPGTYKVTVATTSGRAAATGKVTIKLKKGKTSKLITGKLVNGVLTVNVPKLAKGTWAVTISWVGDANYLAARITGGAIKVKK